MNGLPFTDIILRQYDHQLKVTNVLIETDSAGSICKTDILFELGLKPELTDKVQRITGVGGFEIVIEKAIEKIELTDASISQHAIQMGQLDYGKELNEIIGIIYDHIDLKHFVILHETSRS